MDYFSTLPNELLLEIFEYGKILPLLLVCRKFKEVIGNSLMKKVHLVIGEKTVASELVKSEREHQSVYFKFNYKIGHDCLKILNRFSGIKSLELVRCIVEAEVFLKMLHSLPNLESLSIFTTYLKRSKEEKTKELDPPCLKKLKSLNFRNSDAEILFHLRGASIETLSILFPVQYPAANLTDFLRSQPNIKTMDLALSGIDDSLMVFIAQDMKKLKKLSLECDRLNMDLIRNLELANASVKILHLFGLPHPEGDFNVILSFFKQVKDLEIEMNTHLEPVNIAQLHQQTPNLESLSIVYCSGDYFNHLQLGNLKRLKLTDGNHSAEEWTRLANRNPTIEKLIIKDESTTEDIFRTICIEFRNLKHLEVNYDPQRLTPEILNFICDPMFPTNIRFLKIVQRATPSENFLSLTDEHKTALNANLGFRFLFN